MKDMKMATDTRNCLSLLFLTLFQGYLTFEVKGKIILDTALYSMYGKIHGNTHFE